MIKISRIEIESTLFLIVFEYSNNFSINLLVVKKFTDTSKPQKGPPPCYYPNTAGLPTSY